MIKKIMVFITLIVGITLAVIYRDAFDIAVLQQQLNRLPFFAPVIFMLLYIVGTVFFFPGSVLTLAGGALFGPVWGTLYNLLGATIGAILSFLVARYLAQDWVANKTGGRLKQLVSGVEKEGWRFVAFTRLVPLFPFNLLNYALGLTKIKLLHYSWATLIFMFPGALVYTYLGYIGKEAATGGDNLVQKSLFALALIGVVGFLPKIVNSIRKGGMVSVTELRQKMAANEDLLLLDVRSEQDYSGEQGHIKGAKLLPLEQLPGQVEMLMDYKDKPVLTICRTDRRSAKAAKLLEKQGFSNVKVVRMGMTDWLKNQYPVER